MAIEGVDYAWSRPDIGQLAAAGKVFACRYGGPGSLGKQLDPVEAQALSAAGVAIVANAEGGADGLLGGWSAGADWARLAEAHFQSCGMPAGRPIYLSVDFDVTAGQWPAVADALRGAASVLGAARVGVYGGRRAIEWARRDGLAGWWWQTYAWSGGVWVPGNHIEQYRNGVELAGATLDLDRALASDYGQWTIGDDMPDWFRQEDWDNLRWRNYSTDVSGSDLATGGPAVGQELWLPKFLKAISSDVRAGFAADATRDAAMLAAIEALASDGNVDTAAIINQIKAEAQATRDLVQQQHEAEMAALAEEKAAEIAGLQAELERLTGEAS